MEKCNHHILCHKLSLSLSLSLSLLSIRNWLSEGHRKYKCIWSIDKWKLINCLDCMTDRRHKTVSQHIINVKLSSKSLWCKFGFYQAYQCGFYHTISRYFFCIMLVGLIFIIESCFFLITFKNLEYTLESIAFVMYLHTAFTNLYKSCHLVIS